MIEPPSHIIQLAKKLGFSIAIEARIILKAKGDNQCEKDFNNWHDVHKYLKTFVKNDKVK